MPKNVLAGADARKARDYWALRKWLASKEIKISSIAKDVGVSQVTAGRTIQGLANNRPVLKRLLDLGCPERILGLPQDLKDEAHVKG